MFAGVLREWGVSIDENVQGLFVLDPGLRREPSDESALPGLAVKKTYRPFTPDQEFLLPPSLGEWLPADHMARFIADLVDEHLDLTRIHASYKNKKGGPPFDPRLMVRILLFGYATGVRSSRKLEAACVDVVAFRWLAGGTAPDFRSIAANATWQHWGICSFRRWRCARPPGWSPSAKSHSMAPKFGRMLHGTKR